MGTTVSQMPSVHNRLNGVPNGVHVVESIGPVPRPGLFIDGPIQNSEWQAQQQDQLESSSENPFNSSGRPGVLPMFGGQATVVHNNIASYDRDDQTVDADAAAIAHQEEQRGVSHLSNAVSAVATNAGQPRQSLTHVSPNGVQVAPLGQATTALSNVGSSLIPGNQLGIEKRGPVEFNHAIGYVNKIKVQSNVIM